ncbi:MAG: hypothetical protein V8S96_00990 [Lachnospiraceae bacterium]
MSYYVFAFIVTIIAGLFGDVFLGDLLNTGRRCRICHCHHRRVSASGCEQEA